MLGKTYAKTRAFEKHFLATRFEPPLCSAESPEHQIAVFGPFDVNPIACIGGKRCDASEKPRFYSVRSAVFRAEYIAISAIVTVVGKVGKLMLFVDSQNPFASNYPRLSILMRLDDGQFRVSDGQGEVCVVGTNRDAFVARDAIEKMQFVPSFFVGLSWCARS